MTYSKTRTPAGAVLSVTRKPKWSSIQIDRIVLATDATPSQAETATALSRAAAVYVIRNGKKGGVSCGSGRVIWCGTYPTADLDEALAAYFALEQDDHKPARAMAARYDDAVSIQDQTKEANR